MKDKLKHLWEVQKDFNEIFCKERYGKTLIELTMEEKKIFTKNHLLSIVKETMEVLDVLPNWKEHRVVSSDFIISNLYEEIIDVNKFSLGLAQIWDMTFDKYYEEYLRKSYVVEQRWIQEHDLKLIDKDSKIVGIDIDGVLGEHEKCFLDFINRKHPNKPFLSIKEFKFIVGIKIYEDFKSEYRQSGCKAEMEACEGAAEFTKKLKELGYVIIILSARPYEKYYTIYPDTLKFLKDKEIVFDNIVFDKDKHLKIIKEFPNLNFMIEDDVEISKQIADLGFKVFCKNYDMNHHNIIPFKNLLTILKHLPYPI